MKPFIHDITGIDYLKAFLAVKHIPYSLLLDSADPNHKDSRYSFVMCNPIETIHVKDKQITVTNWEQKLSFTGDPFDIIQSRMASWIKNAERIPNMPPFQGGAAGLFGYDLGRYLEDLPETAENNAKTPDMAIGIYDQVLAHDGLLNKTYIFTHARNKDEAHKKCNFLIDLFSQDYETPQYQPHNLDWKANFDPKNYMEQVETVIDYIHKGDIFQANLAQRFDADLPPDFDPFIHYLHMREVNPAPFSTYMNIGDIKISSSSPERFITIRDRHVETRPIKGTRPRANDTKKDRAYKQELLASAKDNAENTMIVDLLRNDLSRICEAQSINVSELCKLESFASVHHLVSTIHGKLADNKNAVDLMRACFPGGSITGAPKIRAMEIIESLEPTRRAAYCGSIGYIGFDDTMDTNILIRTLTYEDNHVSLQVGGGIVADSNPKDEYQETLDKAEAIFKSFKTEKNQKTAFSKAI
ncbi:MAG: aminodeoxychorismate synthase, component I [Zetaproteobacteria bacterium]|nr:MAG: aminodeoxychorismate synthase, component I [Zetaproteobacteria bacterium]